MEKETENIAKYLYEMGQLKRVKRSGWWIAGVDNPESVAEHSFRTGVIAYILAGLERADPAKAGLMALFHDTAEARTNDLHRVGRRYVDWKGVDLKALKDQVERLPEKIGGEVASLFEEYERAASKEAKIARDADLLECLIQAREYQSLGHQDVADWITNAMAALQTESAKEIAMECVRMEPKEWWKGLKA